MKLNRVAKQTGFTLVEVLTVMLVLVAIASVTIEVSSDLAFQNRYEVTQDRYEKIKRAIIGRPDVLINGQPDISGFVADMGRLPFALQELIDGNHCPDTRYFNQTDCDTALGAGNWVATPNWKGPYISSTKTFNNALALSDGWGNNGQGNYGWKVTYYSDTAGTTTTTIADAISMGIQSLGKNGAANGSNYDADYPPTAALPSIRQIDWMVAVNNFPLSVIPRTLSGTCSVTPADPATCSLTGGTWNAGTCLTYTTPTSKLGCESAGGTWTFTQTTNLCLRLIKGSKAYITETGFDQTIVEDGRNQLLVFPSQYFDANGGGTKNPGEEFTVIGQSIGLLYRNCSGTGVSNVYPSSRPTNICIDTAGSLNFTQANCVTNGGTWIQDTDEKYCDGIVGTACTGSTGSELGGTVHSSFKVTLLPHSILPTVTW